MKNWKKVALIIIIIFIGIQFIRPQKNLSTILSANDISKHYFVPADVQTILKKACYDCHSNNTIYPWYFNVQPIAWWLSSHIKNGKEHLNFSEFASYPIARQYKKLDDIIDEVKQGDMPLPVYTFEHHEARLNNIEKEKIYNLCNSLRDTIKANYPADSLVIKKH
ncbi:MAG: heme-binding domain-containing protein [Chitinophagaceae bacterium]